MYSTTTELASLWESTPTRKIPVPDFPIGIWPDTWSPWTTPSSTSSTMSSPRSVDRSPQTDTDRLRSLHHSLMRLGLRDSGSVHPKATCQSDSNPSKTSKIGEQSSHSIHRDDGRSTNKNLCMFTGNRWSAFETELEAWEKRLSQGKNAITISRSHLTGFTEFLRRLRTVVRRKSEEGLELCAFCRNNGEPFEVYITHKVKDASGRVTCPVLRLLSCPLCKSTGDAAHTIKYCPYRSSS
ncbi:Nanos 1 [Fasciola hepatica]|uniref:Nanos 1 n=1 Tax=Fasciola hepatica TaxID=6192 RepID=A0A4E0R106_FASHE|nr:Nanos 1 [Fasciola hepatica]